MSKILISACLLGKKVRFDGKDNYRFHSRLQEKIDAGDVIAVCPEILGGLSVPRSSGEILDSRPVTQNGEDMSENFLHGAKRCSS